MQVEVPDTWRDDPMGQFLLGAFQNVILTLTKVDALVISWLREIDTIFADTHRVKFPGTRSIDLVLPPFVHRCRFTFLGCLRLSASGQIPESYMVGRGCLELALYAHYFHVNPKTFETWAHREETPEAKKNCRKEFTYNNLIKILEGGDTALCTQVRALYERSLDYGAHPNIDGHVAVTEFTESGGHVHGLLCGTDVWKVAIQTTVQVGVCALRIFDRIFTRSFTEAGISQRIQHLVAQGCAVKRGLPPSGTNQL